jgi:hypothetical protein
MVPARSRRRGLAPPAGLIALLAALASCAAAASARASATPATGRGSVLLVFAGVDERELQQTPGMSVGIMSAAQGAYSSAQLALDVSQGARIGSSAYGGPPPALALHPSASGAVIAGWQAALARASAAPQLLDPGLLAASIPGGGAYVGIAGAQAPGAPVAADRAGSLAAISLGAPSTLAARAAALAHGRRMVVADLPAGALGEQQLRALASQRPAGELLIVLARPRRASEGALLWVGAAGLAGGAGEELSSSSTTERGLVVDIDLTATILQHLGGRTPSLVRGSPLRTDGRLDADGLRGLMARLRVIGGRRLRALAWLLLAWAALALLCARGSAARAWALRVGALGVLWAPVVALLPAALEPAAASEYALIVLLCLALGALTDALTPWPRGLIVPAVCALAALSADALAGTQLLLRSLLGPDPLLGARFYGIGNELKSALAVLVLAGVAGALYPTARGRRAAFAIVLAGALLAAIEGSARIGAGVGGVILVSFGFALAAVSLLPGAITRRRALVVVLAPLLGLLALAVIDLVSAHGTGHFTGSVLHARSFTDVRDIVVRRYEAAWQELRNHAMPAATAIALACAVWALRRQPRLLAPVGGDPAWRAALWGALGAGLAGALVEDSGPLLLVVAVFTGGCVCCYLWGRPRPAQAARELGGAVLAAPVEHHLVP